MSCASGMIAFILTSLFVVGLLATVDAEGFRLYATWFFLAVVGAALSTPFALAIRGEREHRRRHKSGYYKKRDLERKAKLLQPDLEAARHRFGGQIPPDVLQVFSDPESLLELEGQELIVDNEESHSIGQIVPLDGWDLGFEDAFDRLGVIALADDDFSNAYVVRRSASPAERTPVLFWDLHETDLSDLGLTVEAFFRLPRASL